MSLDCLNNIIGLSETECTCWDSSKPVDFVTLNESLSGLYVSQPNTIFLSVGLIAQQIAKTAECGTC